MKEISREETEEVMKVLDESYRENALVFIKSLVVVVDKTQIL